MVDAEVDALVDGVCDVRLELGVREIVGEVVGCCLSGGYPLDDTGVVALSVYRMTMMKCWEEGELVVLEKRLENTECS